MAWEAADPPGGSAICCRRRRSSALHAAPPPTRPMPPAGLALCCLAAPAAAGWTKGEHASSRQQRVAPVPCWRQRVASLLPPPPSCLPRSHHQCRPFHQQPHVCGLVRRLHRRGRLHGLHSGKPQPRCHPRGSPAACRALPPQAAVAALSPRTLAPLPQSCSLSGARPPAPSLTCHALSTLQRTTDAGHTWVNVSVTETEAVYGLRSNLQLWSVAPATPTVGYLGGTSSQLNASGNSCTFMAKTTDAGGQGWRPGRRPLAGRCVPAAPPHDERRAHAACAQVPPGRAST